MCSEFYALDKDGNEKYAKNEFRGFYYATDFSNTQIYTSNANGQFPIENQYTLNERTKPYYPKDLDNKEFVINYTYPSRYPEHNLGNKYYEKDRNENEFAINKKKYAWTSRHAQSYPKD